MVENNDLNFINIQSIEEDAVDLNFTKNSDSFEEALDLNIKSEEDEQLSKSTSVSASINEDDNPLSAFEDKDDSSLSVISSEFIPKMGVIDECKYNLSPSVIRKPSIDDCQLDITDVFSPLGVIDIERESGIRSDSGNMVELAALLNDEIPEGRNNLLGSFTNLERVAEYCEGNYFQSENKKIALEETKNYTTQSLASVAYQINTLAYNFLQLLDLQASQLSEMEGQMNHIAQMVMIHKEKVARREIGVLTANKTTNRQYKIIAPLMQEKPIKYVRKPIDFNALDDIGHGVRSNVPKNRQRGGSQGSVHHPASPSPLGVGPAPTTKPPTPPSIIRGTGSLSKSSREYRTPPAVAPPQVPSHYAPNYPLGHPRRERGPGYSTLPHPSTHHSPQVGMVHPQPQQNQSSVLQISHPFSNDNNMPPPPSPLTLANHSVSGMEMLDNSRQYLHTLPRHSSNSSPPLPPPPEEEHARFGQPRGGPSGVPIIPVEHDLPGWVPKNYIEKVVAIYDYFADKEDELSFQESAVIYVLKKNEDGWWEGVMDGTTGLFPGNYVEPCM